MKLILGDDHPIFSAVLDELFREAGHTVLDRGLSVPSALAQCQPAGADACVVGLDSTPLSVLEVPSLTGMRNSAAIVLLMPAKHGSLLRRALELPVSGVAMREDDFVDVLRLVTDSTSPLGRRAGCVQLSPCARGALRAASAWPAVRRLTRREHQVLRRLAAGETPSKVAGSMDVRVTTVRSHIASVFHKLDAHTMVEAVAIARRAGLLDECGVEVPAGSIESTRAPASGFRAVR